jgi:cell division protein FtsB
VAAEQWQMEFDPAIVLLGTVVLLLIAILVGVVYAARDGTQAGEEVDELLNRLETIAPGIADQIRHREEVERLRREIRQLREENERLRHDWRRLLQGLARITELLRRQPPPD